MSQELDRELIADIIRKHLRDSGFGLTITADAFDPERVHGMIQFASNSANPFDSLLNLLCQDRRGERRLYYHFRQPAIAELILRHLIIQINHLAWQEDDQEFIEFYERAGLWSKESGFVALPLDESGKPIPVLSPEEVREQVFALSLSRIISDEHFNRFGDVCLVLDIIDKPSDEPEGQRHYEMRDIHYDSGDSFTWIPAMQAELLEKCGSVLNLSRVPVFAALTKRLENFDVETETRLVMDALYVKLSYGDAFALGPQSVEDTGGRKRVFISRTLDRRPFSHAKYFHIRLRGVIFKDDINPITRACLTELVTKNFPDAFIAKDVKSGIELTESFKFSNAPEPDPNEEWRNELGISKNDGASSH